MLELIAELEAAKNLLELALDRYLDACITIQSYYSQCSALTVVPKNLSDCVAGEVGSTCIYESKIKQAQSIISQARNLSITLAPVHALPAEILARIFLLVVGVSCGVDVDDSKSRAMPRYPDFLSQVCLRWRHAALDLPELWTHIDLVYYHSSSWNYLDRAEVFVARARQLPLDVHIRIPVSPDYHSGPEVMYEFLSSIVKRIVSLALASPKAMLAELHKKFYAFLFENLEPASLLRLSITDRSPFALDFIHAPDHPGNETEANGENEDMVDLDEANDIRLAITPGRFEALLLHVKFLRLDGIYLRWTSQAYHGLVELHLDQPFARNRRGSITASELRTIFTSSPKLAILHFGLEIIDDPDGGHVVLPVNLEDLEVLNLRLLSEPDHVARLLSLLIPGSKPLQLTIRLRNAMGTILNTNSPITQFFKRTNIGRLCISAGFQEFEIGTLLTLLPRLRVLALMSFHYTRGQVPPTTIPGDSPSGSLPQVDTVYFYSGHYGIEYLDQLVKSYSIESVVMWKTHVYRNGEELGIDELTAELFSRRSVFRYVDALEDSPIKWGFPI